MSEDKTKAVVAKVIDDFHVVLNRGRIHGVQEGDKYQIYYLGDEDIIDPETNKSLGKLEYIVGVGKVTNVQDNMCILESSEYAKGRTKKIVKKSNPMLMHAWGDGATTEETIDPPEWLEFQNPERGQRARLLN